MATGLSLKGSGGYRYFGAAKDLPGVKELFARHAAKMTKRKRGDIYKYITPDYYGLRDEEDGVILELEEKMARENRRALEECREEYGDLKKRQKLIVRSGTSEAEGGGDSSGDSSDDGGFLEGGIAAHEAVPSKEVLAQVLLKKKKDALLNRFG